MDVHPSSSSLARHTLIVDDNAVNRVVAKRYCQHLGLVVTEAPHGTAALAELQRRLFDLVRKRPANPS